MKKHAKHIFKITVIIIFCFSALFTYAQKKQKTYMSIEYKQYVNEYRLLEITLRTRVDKKFQIIENAQIEIYAAQENDNILIGTVTTNAEGVAQFAIASNYSFYLDNDNKYQLIAKFKGDDSYKKASKTIEARDLKINSNFSIIDSVKTISLNIREQLKDSLSIPTDEIDFDIYVDRLFADLKIASGSFINGVASANFPDDIPGDINGNLIVRIIVDEKDYQYVELTKTIEWGVPLKKDIDKKKNTATISYVIFMIVSIITIAIFGLLLSKRINNKS